jgi:hypothetical protein
MYKGIQTERKSMESKKIEDLKQLAKDIWAGTVFTDRHIQDFNIVPMVFMPLALGAIGDLSEEDAKDVGMIYEYLSEAGPRSINGYPMFTSCRLLNKDDTKKVWSLYEEVKKMMELL